MAPSVIFDYTPHKLPQDILGAIGLISTSSAQAEAVIEMGIGGCLGIESDYSMAVTTHMNAPLRGNVLRSVAELKMDDLDDLDELDRLLDEINLGFTKRNKYVHNSLCRHPTTGNVYIQSIEARGSVDASLTPISATEIMADANFIYDAGMNLMTFLSVRDLLPPIPPVRRERSHKTKTARKKRRKDMLKGK
jgi:hypothetical protein